MASSTPPVYEADRYQADRPRYKSSLVETILAFHKRDNPDAATDLVVDVATGTGIFARQLVPHFKTVIATDISEAMLGSARKADPNQTIEYVQAPSEDLAFLKDHSVDVITAATGAHWFDVGKFVAEAKRVLKPSGTLAIFGYPGFAHFVDYPECDRLLKNCGLGESRLGPFWARGREVLVNGYRDYHKQLACTGWTGIQRNIYPETIEGEPSAELVPILATEPNIMDFEVTWRILQNFLLTWSPLALYQKQYPGRENAAEEVVREMMAAAGSTNMNEKLRLQWEEILLMCHPPH
ncbi:trans-aconitate methyltransferase 1 [Coemansia sp. RSA 1821]|nr:trans-aconitate methyltransferase 1 [Coemansia sp. RSA 1086]KAJ1747029.1 trans-aconitate methyltransferase 1 [Coemansia sp. RSA 1821]